MSRIVFVLLFLGSSFLAMAQTGGYAKLFANSGSRISDAEKKLIFQKLDLKPAPGGTGFLSGDFEVEARVYPTDLNADGQEDVFVVLSSTGLYGNAGQGYVLFVKNAAGIYQEKEGGDGNPAILKTKNAGFPDLMLGGPGFEYPVYRWNGTEYKLARKVKDGSAESNSAQWLEDYSAAYIKGRK